MNYTRRVKEAMETGRVIVIRHGDTALNAKGETDDDQHKIRGWADVPLDKDGHAQAEALADALKDYPITIVYTSDLERAVDTGHELAKVTNARLHPDRYLRPWHLGHLTGKPVKEAIPHIVHHTKNEDDPVPEGESFRRYRLRFLGELHRILTKAKEQGRTFAIVTHSRGMQATRAWVAAGCPEKLNLDTDVMNDYANEIPTASAFELTPNGDCWDAKVIAKEGKRTGPTS